MNQIDLISQDQRELNQSEPGNSTAPTGSPDSVRLANSIIPVAETYVCPGQIHSISRSVHLARLASGFVECRNCVHKLEYGALPYRGESESCNQHRGPNSSLLTADGVRGVYLNEIDRTVAADWGAAFASMLWDQQPRIGRPAPGSGRKHSGIESPPSSDADKLTNAETTAAEIDSNRAVQPTLEVQSPTNARRGPAVVIGFDERPSSPDVIIGVGLGLRRMGCHVIDLGQTTIPCAHFAVHHLQAVGGIFVTGSGCEPAWTGFHFMGKDALPWSPQDLKELQSRVASKVDRPTRTAGSQRSFHATVPYEAGLWRFFHALRPLQVVCGTSTRLLPRMLTSLFARLPCGLALEQLPTRKRNLLDPNDPDICRVSDAVVSGQKHLGMIVDDDGERCAFVAENGRIVAPSELAALLIDLEMREHHSVKVLADQTLSAQLSGRRSLRRGAFELKIVSPPQMPGSMRASETNLSFTSDSRVWFRNSYPVCDAILTLARVLQALSFSDESMSQVLSRASGHLRSAATA